MPAFLVGLETVAKARLDQEGLDQILARSPSITQIG